MRQLDSKDTTTAREIIANNERDGEIICSCGHQFKYCWGDIGGLGEPVNAGQWCGWMVPFCPSCETVLLLVEKRD